MATIYFSRPAERDLKQLPESVAEVFRGQVTSLQNNPRLGKPLHGPLRGYFSLDFWSAGVSYRYAYEIMKGDVVILMIDTRDNFYKKFTRRIR